MSISVQLRLTVTELQNLYLCTNCPMYVNSRVCSSAILNYLLVIIVAKIYKFYIEGSFNGSFILNVSE